ncbi:proton-conducting transporter transmembrane domain-containing protein [Bythopirellula polymerisocia]|uniref:NADH-quinone oxidoreductase subunit L n=1 Tax=Bythopirellula polymerisocia TaxID=2528003 RepID=A0A5C6C8I9_9BACT|nr:proton-conducting transporter membrane subunit [Bythopirellula polymerisocia]TWU20367.1 NADH-quinone oxidoreductase subunit L [Bythopirellula polymerisocia]
MSTNTLFFILGIAVLVCPATLVVILGLPPLVGRPLSEKTINRYAYAATVIGLLASLFMLAMMLVVGTRHVPIELGNWVIIPQQHFHFHLKFIFDRLSIPYVILSFLLCGTVSAFTSHYLHREQGYGRFYVCYSFFLLGMIVSSLAGTIEVLFFGWELVGLSSALLVAYFQERPAPVINGLRVWSVYRIADAAFLMAAVAMHHLTGAGDFDRLVGTGSWPDGIAVMTGGQALSVGLLLLVAAAGKSALVPLSGWLPRAMEGPTPSSAIFYGALSVHLGAYLLLRVSPLLEVSVPLAVAVVIVGLMTSLMATLMARVQTDIKSALAFASLTQVGIIVVEIGLGFRYIALIHILGHACLRTLQLLRAPTLLHDYHTIENAIGGRSTEESGFWGRRLPRSLQNWSYRFASERGYLDGMLDVFVVRPFQRLFQWCDAAERCWTDFLSGGHSRESDEVQIHNEIVEELRL